jgi:hypothetical protein
MADKDIVQDNGWKWRMLQLAAGIFAPYVLPLPAAAATLSNVAASESSVTLKAANTSRRGLLIHNDADKYLLLKYGAVASSTSFTVKIAAGGYFEMPLPIYQGVVDAIWEVSPTGSARITELT